jgi:hypothetical protein
MDGGATLAVLETKTGGGRREWDGPQSELTASLRRIHVLTIAFPPRPLMTTYLPRLAILEGLVRRRLLLLQPGDTLGHGACNPCTHIFQGKNRSGD